MATEFKIENWMTGTLGLSGNDLVAFAFLWKVTKQGTEQFDGGFTELAQAMGVTVPTTYNVLRKLVDRKLIEFGCVRDGIKVIASKAA